MDQENVNPADNYESLEDTSETANLQEQESQNTNSVDPSNNVPSLEKQVSNYLSNKNNYNEDGKLVKNDEVSEELFYAIKAENRRRTTESNYNKIKYENLQNKQYAELHKKNVEQLKAKLVENNDFKQFLTPDEKGKLEEFKLDENFDGYSNYLGSLKSKYNDKRLKTIDNSDEFKKSELQVRQTILDEFNKTAKVPITDESLLNVPMRIVNKLEKGEVNFLEYLIEAHSYLTKNYSVGKGKKVVEKPNLSKVGAASGTETKKKSDSNYYF